MEYKDNDTKLLLQAVDHTNTEIANYSISKGNGLLLKLQVSGEIQAYDFAEFGLYTNENVPLCGFGPFVINRIPLSKFIMTNGMVSTGVFHPEHQSNFGHVSFWTEDNTNAGVELNFKETLNYWNTHLPNHDSIELKLILSGYSESGKKTYLRDINVINLKR